MNITICVHTFMYILFASMLSGYIIESTVHTLCTLLYCLYMYKVHDLARALQGTVYIVHTAFTQLVVSSLVVHRPTVGRVPMTLSPTLLNAAQHRVQIHTSPPNHTLHQEGLFLPDILYECEHCKFSKDLYAFNWRRLMYRLLWCSRHS